MDLTINNLVNQSHAIATEKGWWIDSNRNIGELIALIHSEASEALEIYRIKGRDGLKDNWLSENEKPEGFTIELADIIIRIADLCGEFGLNLEDALNTKMEFNKSRPYRHGDKKA
jgi:NTP pyrophosphatase (non-canonical NTP hydrolase)